MAGAIFETKAHALQDYNTLHFFNYRAIAESEKHILEAFSSNYWQKDKYWPVWESMSVDDVVFTAQAILSLKDIQQMEAESKAIEKPKEVAKKMGITTMVISGNNKAAMGRHMKIDELKDAIYKQYLIDAILSAIKDLPVMREKLQVIYKFERAEKMANAGIAV